MRSVPFGCSAPSAGGSALVAVGMPSISSRCVGVAERPPAHALAGLPPGQLDADRADPADAVVVHREPGRGPRLRLVADDQPVDRGFHAPNSGRSWRIGNQPAGRVVRARSPVH